MNIARESVSLLNRLGFDYLEIIPFSPDMEITPAFHGFDIAITHGLSGLVPAGIKKNNRPRRPQLRPVHDF
ncbi:hypothetical protein RWE15_02350 [Virgibacillus halophilus]|uniref:Uncharacterized protein n=1 Tax=Tigheibacillus halophilus TaxID=361280 RepID=A0ABU5C2E8_9BACI|nr:hypothetical protein [Virgibacillus halophilus]